MQLQDKLVMFENRLTKVFKHRSKLAKRQQISCYRIYENDLPEFPICIEMYDDKIYDYNAGNIYGINYYDFDLK